MSINYIWTGSTDNTWSKNTNWNASSGSGYPNSVNDTVTISSITAINCLLDSNRTIGRLVLSADSLNLNTKTLVTSTSSSLTAGCIYNGTVDCRGSSIVFSGTTVNVVVLISGLFQFSNTTFYQAVTADNNGGTACTSNGNNIYKASVILSNSGGGSVTMSKLYRDIYEKPVSVFDTLGGTISLAVTDTSFFLDDVTIECKGNGINFGNVSGYASLASGKKLLIGTKGYNSGTLLLHNFLQNGSATQTLTITGSGILNLNASKFGGDITFTAPSLLCKNSTFSAKSYFTKTGTVNNSWEGGNSFAGLYRFTNTASSSQVTMQANGGDYYGDSVTINSGSSRYFASTSGESVYNNSLYFTGNLVDFSQGSGSIKFAGSGNNLLKGTDPLSISNLLINKPSGTLTLQAPVKITSTLTFTLGNIVSDSTNLLTFASGSSWSNASNQSFVTGPVKKIGNSAFTFPIGKGNSMSIAGISAPSNSSDAFMVEYFDSEFPEEDLLDSNLTSVSVCGYWKISRIAGTTDVNVSLGWNDFPCLDYMDTNITMAVWNDSIWNKIDIDDPSANEPENGSIVSSEPLESYTYFKVANVLTPVISVGLPSFTRSINDYFGWNVWDVIKNTDASMAGTYYNEGVNKLSPGTLRFPAAIEANWWDWKRGRFIKDRKIGNKTYYLPELFQDYEQTSQNGGNGLPALTTDFYKSVYKSGAVPIFSLNNLSSDVLFQTAFLYHSWQNNVRVQFMEMGGEVYKVADYNAVTFPTGKEYASESIKWITAIKRLYNNVQFASTPDFQFGLNVTRFNPYETPPRTLSWNKTMFDEIDSYNSLHTGAPFIIDAVILHNYTAGSLTNSVSLCGTPINNYYEMPSPFLPPLCTKDMELVFSGVFKNMFGEKNVTDYKGLVNEELNPSSTNDRAIPNVPVWITEYNSNESLAIFNGSWAQGLSVAFQTLLYLESDRITKVNCFKLIGDAIYSGIFDDEGGLNYPRNSPKLISGAANIHTEPGAQTASGLSLSVLAKAMRNAKYAGKLIFSSQGPNLPRFSSYERYNSSTNIKEPLIYGWYFKDSLSHNNQIVIINMSNSSVILQNPNSGAWGPLKDVNEYEEMYCDPAVFIRGEPLSNFNVQTSVDFVHDEEQPVDKTIELHAYSIMRFYKKDCALMLKAQKTKVCSGTTSSLTAFGDPSLDYTWTVSPTTDVTLNAGLETQFGSTVSFDVAEDLINSYADFTVSVSNNGCTTSQTVRIYFQEPPTLEITDGSGPVRDRIICKEDNHFSWDAVLSYSGASPAAYHCILINSNSEGVAESDETVTTLNAPGISGFNVDTTAQYYVHAFDGTCAVEAGPFTITIPGMNIDDLAYTCDGSYTISELQVPYPETTDDPQDPGDIGYLWTGGSTLATPTFTGLSSITTISVTMTYIDSNGDPCTIEDQITIQDVDCCTGSDYTFENGSVQDLADLLEPSAFYDAPAGSGTIIIDASSKGGGDPLKIAINGKLFITRYNLRLINCHLLLGEAAEIVVDRHIFLDLRGTVLEACAASNKMWKGITLLESATLSCDAFIDKLQPPDVTYYNQINDAQYAVTAVDRSRIFMDKTDKTGNKYCSFKRNYISLYTPPFGAGGLYDVDFRLANILITSESSALSTEPYIGQTPTFLTNSNYSFAGMLFNDLGNGVIGSESGNDYRIELRGLLNNGIIANNSTLMVTNCRFKDIKPDGVYTGVNGIGLKTIGRPWGNNVLVQKGFGQASATPSFEDCDYGIIGVRTTMDVTDNNMEDVRTGIRVWLPQNRSISVMHNAISCFNSGIEAYNTNFATYVRIGYNVINVDNTSTGFTNATGISMYEYSSPTKPLSNGISQNEITLVHGNNGILLNNTHNTYVYSNNISMDDDAINSNGIFLNTCFDLNVWGNSIEGNATDKQIAVRTTETTGSLLASNLTDDTQTGLLFSGINTNTYMHCNEMDNHDIGTYVDFFSHFGHPHNMEGNKWIISGGTYPTAGFDYKGIDANLDRFTANPNSTQWPDPIYVNGILDPSWFGIGPDEDPCGIDPPDERPVFYENDSIVVIGDYDLEDYADSYNFIADMNVYEKAQQFPDSVASGGVIDSFYMANETSSIGLFASLNTLSNSLFTLTEPDLIYFNYADSAIIASLKQISFNDSLMHETISMSDSMDLVNKNEVLKTAVFQIRSENSIEYILLDSLNSYYADSIADENSGISTSLVIEENISDLNRIFYSTIAKGIFEFDSAQSAQIYAIAIQCPREGGKSVPAAQGIYRMINDTIVFSSDTLCIPPGYRIGKHKAIAGTGFVYPNPATSWVNIKYDLQNKSTASISISDVLNKKIVTKPLSIKAQEVLISLENFQPGIYFYKITDEKTTLQSGKFCVIK